MAVRGEYFGIKKSGLVLEGRRLHKETGSPFDATMAPPNTLRVHTLCQNPPDPLAFTVSSSSGAASRPQSALSRPDPHLFLTRRSGSGGMASSLQKEYVGSPLRPMTSPVSGRLTMIMPDLEAAHQAMILSGRASAANSRPSSPTPRRPVSAFPASPSSAAAAGLAGGRERAGFGDGTSSPLGSPRPGTARLGGSSSSGHFGAANSALGGHSGGGGLGVTGTTMNLNLYSPPGSPLRGPPPGGAKSPRMNPPNTEFRKHYERGDLPCAIDPKSVRRRLVWHLPFDRIDIAHFLPIFVDGLREEEFPYAFVAVQGAKALVEAAGPRLLPIVPSLIVPIRNALNTRRPNLMVAAIDILQAVVLADTRPTPSNPVPNPVIGRALVPYYRQLLPVMNIYLLSNRNLGDKVDYGQRRGDCLGDRITETLQLLETYGGEDAFVNIKYLIPTHECVSSVSVSGFGTAAATSGSPTRPSSSRHGTR